VQDQELETKGKPPYCGWTPFKQAWEKIIKRTPVKVDAAFLQERCNLEPKAAEKVAAALKFLGVTDSDGDPVVSVWKSIGQSDPTAYRTAVKSIVQRSYGKLFSTYTDALEQSETQLQDYFGDAYDVGPGSRRQVVAFFQQLRREAGMLEGGKGATNGAAKKQPDTARPQRSGARTIARRAAVGVKEGTASASMDRTSASSVHVVVNLNVTVSELDEAALDQVRALIRLAKSTDEP
jgi:hypothetical protein